MDGTCKKTPAILALEDGTIFHGYAAGSKKDTAGEVVFNTSMTGYQEIITDKSYCNQIITFTFPHIGIVGCNFDDYEAKEAHIAGCIIKNISTINSNWRAQQTLNDFLIQHDIPAISDIDTRAITEHIRERGTMMGIISTDTANLNKILDRFNNHKMANNNLTPLVCVKDKKKWHSSSWPKNIYLNKEKSEHSIGIVDFGLKNEIARQLINNNCSVTIIPPTTSFESILESGFDGILLSNGPGDPRSCENNIYIVKNLMLSFKKPILGICFGHQLMALASGAKIIKMKFGHHGSNHPILDIKNNTVTITSQNHNYVVDDQSITHNMVITHRSLFDNTIQGIQYNENSYSFQGHPEAGPGPNEMQNIFNAFILKIKKHKVEGANIAETN